MQPKARPPQTSPQPRGSYGNPARDKRSSRGSPNGESGKLSSVFLWLGRLLAITIFLMAPWWIGSVRQLPQFVMYCLAIGGITMLWFAMAFMKRRRHHFPWLAIPVILGIGLLVFQTLPLSGTVAHLLASKQSEMYAAYAAPAAGELLVGESGNSPVVRVTMDLDGTRKSINLMLLGLLCLLLGSYFFSSRKSVILLPLVATVNGVAISGYGVIQRLQSGRRIFGTIELTEGGVPFGPFVNPNNAAGYLLLCLACSLGLLFVVFNRHVAGRRPRQIITNDYPVWERARLHTGLFFAELNVPKLLTLIASTMIVLGVLATLSRGGLLSLLAGSFVTAVYYSLTRRSLGLILPGVLVVAIAMAAVTSFGFGEQLSRRLAKTSDADFLTSELRFRHWTETAPAIVDFAPLGSGVGSYHTVHRLYRADSEERIFYHAENQYFQTLVEAGVPGLILLLSALLILGLSVRFLALRGNSPKTTAVCLIGVFLLSSQCVAALFDFGFYIPANAVAMAMICGMISGQAHSLADRLRKKYIFRFSLPAGVNMCLLLAVFAAGLFAALNALRYTRIEQVLGSNPALENHLTTDLATTDRHIEALQESLAVAADADAFRRLGELYILRYRLSLYEDMIQSLTSAQAGNSAVRERVWLSTGLDRMHAYVQAARQANDLALLQRWRSESPVKPNLLPNAVFYLKKSRGRNPLQPAVHLLLGQLHALSEMENADQPHLVRACELAPANAVTHFITGLMDLQAARLEDACRHLRICLELDRSRYDLVIQATAPRLSGERIIRDVLPDNAFMLFDFASNHLDTQSAQPLRIETYRRARALLESEYRDDRKSLVVLSDIQRELGDLDAAIKTLRLAVDLNQEHQQLRIKLVQLLKDTGQLDEALEQLRWIRRHGEFRPNLESLETSIRKAQKERLIPR